MKTRVFSLPKIFVSLSLLVFMGVTAQASSNDHEPPSVIHLDSELKPNRPWIDSRESPEKAIRRLLGHLESSSTGEVLLSKAREKARENGKKLIDMLEAGKSSLLDTTLVRRFTPDRPDRIHYETKSKVLINRRHSTLNAILDLAHELTHFAFRDPFNPYKNQFTPREFVRSTVEGEGGEVEAYLIECKVLQELYPDYAKDKSNCNRVRNEQGKLSKKEGIREFYKVGDHYELFADAAQAMEVSPQVFQNLSREESQFISSAYGLPYPVAAIKEYQVIMGKVCENDERRISLMQSGNGEGRSPASEERSLSELVKTHKKRCRDFL